MRYEFKSNQTGEIFTIYNWDTKYHKSIEVEVMKDDNYKTYPRTIREDCGGKFFTWDKEKYYLEDYVHFTLNELIDKIEAGEHIRTEQLTQCFIKHGIDKIRIELPMKVYDIKAFGIGLTSNNRKTKITKINEETFEVKSNYKITLVPYDEDDSVATENFYISDLLSLIRESEKYNLKIRILREEEAKKY